MTDGVCDGLIAIYDDLPHALEDFVDIVAFESELAFDAAIATKSASGEVEVRKSHHAQVDHRVSHGIGVGLAAGALAALLPGVGLVVGAGAGALAGGAVEGHKDVKVRHEEHDEFVKIATEALDNGETLLAVMCAPLELERFNHLASSARKVVEVDVADLPT